MIQFKFVALLIIVIIISINSQSSKDIMCSFTSQNSKVVCQNKNISLSGQKDCDDSYKDEKDNFSFSMCFKKQTPGQENLIITLVNKANYKEYLLRINEQFLIPSRENNYYFTSPKELMEQFKENFKNVSVNEEGIIKYRFRIGRQNRQMTLVTKEIKGKVQENIIQQVNTLRTSINAMNEKHANQINKLNSLLKQMKQHIQRIEKMYSSQKGQKENCKKQIISLKQVVQNQIKISEELNKKISKNDEQIKALSQRFQKTNLIEQNNAVQNLHRYAFSVFHYNKNSLLVQRTGGNNIAWYSYIYHNEIKVNTIMTTSIRMIKSNHYLFGITTSNKKQKYTAQNHDDIQTLTYYTHGSLIFANGGHYSAGRAASEGGIIQMTVDLVKWTVQWNIDKRQLIGVVIPVQMRNKPLFIQISMHYLDDAVEFTY